MKTIAKPVLAAAFCLSVAFVRSVAFAQEQLPAKKVEIISITEQYKVLKNLPLVEVKVFIPKESISPIADIKLKELQQQSAKQITDKLTAYGIKAVDRGTVDTPTLWFGVTRELDNKTKMPTGSVIASFYLEEWVIISRNPNQQIIVTTWNPPSFERLNTQATDTNGIRDFIDLKLIQFIADYHRAQAEK